MDTVRFDALTRALAASRRGLLTSLSAFGLSAIDLPGSGQAKKKKRKKLQRNSFNCVDMGKACRGKDAVCCSGICQGKKPKKGKKDTSRCLAHNVLDCEPGADSCLQLIPCGTNGLCYQTTGQASFCGKLGACFACQKDVDCEAAFGPGAACVVCADCAQPGNTVCLFPAV